MSFILASKYWFFSHATELPSNKEAWSQPVVRRQVTDIRKYRKKNINYYVRNHPTSLVLAEIELDRVFT